MLQLQLIKNSSVSLQHYVNSVQCCLVLNFTFTQTTNHFLILVTHHNDIFTDDKEILDCLISLPCISSNRKQKKRHVKCRNIHHDTDTSWHHCHQNHCHHNDTAEQCYLNLPEDMVEHNPLDLENIINKLLNKISQFLLFTKRTDKGIFDWVVYTTARSRRGGRNTSQVGVCPPLVTIQLDECLTE